VRGRRPGGGGDFRTPLAASGEAYWAWISPRGLGNDRPSMLSSRDGDRTIHACRRQCDKAGTNASVRRVTSGGEIIGVSMSLPLSQGEGRGEGNRGVELAWICPHSYPRLTELLGIYHSPSGTEAVNGCHRRSYRTGTYRVAASDSRAPSPTISMPGSRPHSSQGAHSIATDAYLKVSGGRHQVTGVS
jgi:hypothetical protein